MLALSSAQYDTLGNLTQRSHEAPRISTGEDAMMNTVLNGKNAMPPRGTCSDCSDDDLKAAVQYMLSKVR